jgi:hypothetical protein
LRFRPQGGGEGGSAAHFGGGGSLGNITTKIHIKHGSHREKGRNCVFFMYKMLCSEYVRMQDFAFNFQNKKHIKHGPHRELEAPRSL